MKGYKAFESNLTCLDYQFSATQTNTFDGKPILCRQGFHFCTDLQDVVKYYNSPCMRVFEIEASGIITNAKDGCSKRACSEITLVKEISLYEVMLSITKSEPAYKWAEEIGNRDIMINHIKESEWAYEWARWIGNQDFMITKITESEWAFYWAKNIGNRDIMINHIKDSEWAYKWALNIGNRDIMIDRITESAWAYMWARDIGNRDIMKSRVT
ncbi:MAG: hypothetical protein E6R13_03435, partial [Spirochaetes bacterium]